MVVSCLPLVQRGANISLPLCLDAMMKFNVFIFIFIPSVIGTCFGLCSFFTPSDDLSLAAVGPYLPAHTMEETGTETVSFDISIKNKLPRVSALC